MNMHNVKVRASEVATSAWPAQGIICHQAQCGMLLLAPAAEVARSPKYWKGGKGHSASLEAILSIPAKNGLTLHS